MSEKIYWSPEEDEILRTWYGRVSAAQIGEKIGRSSHSVTKRVGRLGIAGKPGRWSYARKKIDPEITKQVSVQTTNLPPGILSVIRHTLVG
jgi:hypothetical protein